MASPAARHAFERLPGRGILYVLLVAVALAGGFLAAGVRPAAAQEPVMTYQSPKDGDVLNDRPYVLQMCFEKPINIKDNGRGGDFNFSLVPPGSSFGLGMRIVFQRDGYGVAVYPGPLPSGGQSQGEWTFTWRVTAPERTAANQGSLHFKVDASGHPGPTVTPPACPGTGIPAPTSALIATPQRSGSPSPAGGGNSSNGGGTDISTKALLTLAAIGGLLVIGLVGYVVRQKTGFWMHRPPPEESGGGPEHH